jgi:hypothetical protein
MRAHLTLGAALLLVAGALSGCGAKNDLTSPAGGGTTGGTVEEAQVSSALAAEPTLVEDAVFEQSTETTVDGGMPGTAALIHPLRYWRTITDVDRRFVMAFADTDSTGRPTTAHVTVHKFLAGRFNILALPPGIEPPVRPDSLDLVRKPLADHWMRRLVLKRVPVGESDRTAWRIAGTSGVKVTSFDPRSPRSAPDYGDTRILSLRIQSGPLDTTITDPLELFRLRRVMRFEAGVPVLLTATTAANDDVVALMWAGMRFRLHPNGDGTYSGRWMAPPFRGVGHLGVNALSRGTLFDDAAPYDSQAWILPYLVVPDQLADDMP